jgi:predicted TIM-barrel fold metal-dependent hydrolase
MFLSSELPPIWRNYWIFDIHCHIGVYADIRRTMTEDDFINYLNNFNIQKATVSSVTRNVTQDNDNVQKLVRKSAGKVIGMGHINPNLENAVEEVKRIVKMGFKAVKMHPDIDCFNCFDINLLEPVLNEVAKHKLPILFHTGTPPHVTPVHVGFLAQHFTEIPMICGHSGLADSTFECSSAAKMADNVYFDTALASTPPVIENLIRDFGAERVFWGSDVPYGNFISQFFWVYSLNITQREKELVYGENAKKLFSC